MLQEEDGIEAQREDCKLVSDNIERFEASGDKATFNLASSPASSPPKDDDNVVFIIAASHGKSSNIPV